MTGYKIVPDGLSDFAVEISTPGSSRSAKGFPTKAAATAWILEHEPRDATVTEAP